MNAEIAFYDVALGSGAYLAGIFLGGVLFAQLRDWSGDVQLLLDSSQLAQGAGAEWIVTSSLDFGSLKIALVAGLVSVVKSLVATQIGAPNTAATLPVTTDTERG